MSAGVSEQRNFYKGNPLRAWIKVEIVDSQGSGLEMELIVDTGSAYSIIIGESEFSRLATRKRKPFQTNFRLLWPGWAQVVIPDTGFNHPIRIYGSDQVRNAAQQNHPDFQGLAGLPLLRAMNYGGDAGSFWIR